MNTLLYWISWFKAGNIILKIGCLVYRVKSALCFTWWRFYRGFNTTRICLLVGFIIVCWSPGVGLKITAATDRYTGKSTFSVFVHVSTCLWVFAYMTAPIYYYGWSVTVEPNEWHVKVCISLPSLRPLCFTNQLLNSSGIVGGRKEPFSSDSSLDTCGF